MKNAVDMLRQHRLNSPPLGWIFLAEGQPQFLSGRRACISSAFSDCLQGACPLLATRARWSSRLLVFRADHSRGGMELGSGFMQGQKRPSRRNRLPLLMTFANPS